MRRQGFLARRVVLVTGERVSNFFYDSTSLPAKTDLTALPGGADPNQYMRAADFNALAQASYDLRTAFAEGYAVQAKSFGVVGNGTTDDRAALTSAINSAISLGLPLRIGPGTYKISKYIDIMGARHLRIIGGGQVTIVYPSDDITIPTDGAAPIAQMAQSAIVLRYCTNVTIEGIKFQGGSTQNLTNNIGGALYATHCTGLRIRDCWFREGYSGLQQDAQTNTTGVGDSFSVTTGTVTITDAAQPFVAGHVGMLIAISKSVNVKNDGVFPITAYAGPTQISWLNPNAVVDAGPSTFTWVIRDADRDTRVEDCRVETRGYLTTGSDSVIANCHFERPTMNNDCCGIGDKLSLTGTTVTLTDAAARFLPSHHGKYITLAGSTTSANNVTKQLTYISSTQVSFTNASGVAELFGTGSGTSFVPGTWWIMNGDIIGVGVGTGALSFSGTTCTLTAATASFSASDAGKNIRIRGATSPGNNCSAPMTYISSTQVSFPNANAGTASEDYAGVWAFDSYDNERSGGNTYGSTHGIYIFSGRENILVTGCTFIGIRTICVKISGTALPVRNIAVVNNYARECGAFVIGGADESQEHTGILVSGNRLTDITTGRAGWNEGSIISILGARNVVISNNEIHFTRNSINSVDGTGTAGPTMIQASRFVLGASAPMDDVSISGNKMTADPSATTPTGIMSTALFMNAIGQRAKWGSGTLTRNGQTFTSNSGTSVFTATSHGFQTGNLVRVSTSSALPSGLAANTSYWVIRLSSSTYQLATSLANAQANTPLTISDTGTGTQTVSNCIMTLTDSNGIFSGQDAGKTVTFVNSGTGANDGPFVIETAANDATTFTFTNLTGVAGSTTYRIPARSSEKGGACRIVDNQILNCCSTGIQTQYNVGLEITGNTFAGLLSNVQTLGDVAPRIENNREISTGSSGARILLGAGTSWPHITGNMVTNLAIGSSTSSRAWGIATISGSTACDYPLLGKKGRVRPSQAREEVVIAYGSQLFDGDTLLIGCTGSATYTYKATGPSGNQFNTFNTDDGSHVGLVGLINAQTGTTGVTCADYGTGFSAGDIATQHIRIRANAASSGTDGTLHITSTCLNPTALVALRNNTAAGVRTDGRGSGSAGPTADKTVVFSMDTAFEGGVRIWGDNDVARKLLANGTAATGLITCVTNANMADSDYITIGDGIGRAVLYEYDKSADGVTSGRVTWAAGSSSAADVAATLKTAINANQPSLVVTDNTDGTLTITHGWFGSQGNVTITENVANAGFLVAGLSGGGPGGFRPVKAATDAGCCEILTHGTSGGTEEFRWALD